MIKIDSSHVNELPDEVLYFTFSYLEIKTMSKVASTCKRWNILVNNIAIKCLNRLEKQKWFKNFEEWEWRSLIPLKTPKVRIYALYLKLNYMQQSKPFVALDSESLYRRSSSYISQIHTKCLNHLIGQGFVEIRGTGELQEQITQRFNRSRRELTLEDKNPSVRGKERQASLKGLNICILPHDVIQRVALVANLIKIELGHNQLQNLPNLSPLKHLKVLDLSFNQFTKFPEELFQLPNLEEINLERNQISELPKKIDQLSNLISFNANNNKLTSIPAEIGNVLTLQRLSFVGNQLARLPDELANLTKLTSFDVYANCLVTLPAGLASLPNITFFSILSNPMSEGISEAFSRSANNQIKTNMGVKEYQPSQAEKFIRRVKSLTDKITK